MLELALVGTPSAGKSTFFKATTLKDVKIASYPFTTLEPNEGLAHVSMKCPCTELKVNCKKCLEGIRFVPIKIWDIAGLVPDAHLGRGRGIAFLDDVRQAKALIQIIDTSGKTDLEGNPSEDFDSSLAVEMLEKEITYWMFDIFNRDWKKVQHLAPKDFLESLETRFSGLGIGKDSISKAFVSSKLVLENFKNWSEQDCFTFVNELKKLSKPSIIAANKCDVVTDMQAALEKINKKYPEKTVISVSADIELALREAHKHGIIKYIPGSSTFEILKEVDEKHQKALDYMKKFLDKHKTTGVQEVLNKSAFELLDLIVVYPVADENKCTDSKGEILPHAHLIKRGTTVKDFASNIHTDFADKYIGAVDARTKRKISDKQILSNNDIIKIILRP